MSLVSLDDAVRVVLSPAHGPVLAHGLTRPCAALIAARMAQAEPVGPVVVVTPDELSARNLAEDIGFFLALAMGQRRRSPGYPRPDRLDRHDHLVEPGARRGAGLGTSKL